MFANTSHREYYTNPEIHTEEITNDNTGFARVVDQDNYIADQGVKKAKSSVFSFETDIIWSIALIIFLLHVVGIYGIFTFSYFKNLMTTLWLIGMHLVSIFGVSAGAHRLWSHKSFEVKLPLKILLLICFSTSGQNSVCSWVRNHRLHHRFCDTHADPHNTSRGFFYSHVGWVMMKGHPEYIKKSEQIDLSDLLLDPIIVFFEKYNLPLQLLFGCTLPTLVPVYFWNETWDRAIMSQIFIRYIIIWNSVWSLSSIAHVWGNRPYNKNIKAVDNRILNILSIGDGHHNYHHVFPWDYRSAEIGITNINYVTCLIDICAKLGQAYDLKYPSANLVKRVMLKRGDGSHANWSEEPMLKDKTAK